ncbi:MAG: hypothetical protein HXY43_14430 [Fischerella sp.]|uniref:hypothetical protein n=1 Tax=Fischerella sp. TaxID=1191 RepID=UPI00182D90B7|nr:hypothetical protein [Fischerella sp.]NWF60416.1 hypothetical protein [Fischerella sp.]
MSSFYLEAIEYDESLGYWKVTYGAIVTLNGNELQLPNAPIFGAIPAAGNSVSKVTVILILSKRQ